MRRPSHHSAVTVLVTLAEVSQRRFKLLKSNLGVALAVVCILLLSGILHSTYYSNQQFAMASSAAKQSILKLYPHLRKSIQQVQQDVLGYAPPSFNSMRTGYQASKKQLTGVYLNQYYDANPSIDPYARQVSSMLFVCYKKLTFSFSFVPSRQCCFAFAFRLSRDGRMNKRSDANKNCI